MYASQSLYMQNGFLSAEETGGKNWNKTIFPQSYKQQIWRGGYAAAQNTRPPAINKRPEAIDHA